MRKTHLSRDEVGAGAVHVRIVSEDGVDRRARGGRDGQARVSRDDVVRDPAVLPGNPEAELLKTGAFSATVEKRGWTPLAAHLANEEVGASSVDQVGVHGGELEAAHRR